MNIPYNHRPRPHNRAGTDANSLPHHRPSADVCLCTHLDISAKNGAGRDMYMRSDDAIMFHHGSRVHQHMLRQLGQGMNHRPCQNLAASTANG